MVNYSLAHNMMAFFMHFYRKYKVVLTLRKLALIGLFVSLAATAWANPNSLQIISAELIPVEENYAVNAQLDINFNAEVEDALNKGIDPHLLVGAGRLGLSYEEALANKKSPEIKDARQKAKAINFGVPGGLGAATLVKYAKSNCPDQERDK